MYFGMNIARLSILCFLVSILFIILLVFFFFSSSFSFPTQCKLLFSTYELIVVAKSSRVAVFFAFNFILITIFLGLGRTKSSSLAVAGDLDTVFFFHNHHPSVYYNEDINDQEYDDGSDMEDENEAYHGYDGYDEDNDDYLDMEDADSTDDDEKDSDLERRIDEFIAKVTAKWREEFLSESLLCLTAT